MKKLLLILLIFCAYHTYSYPTISRTTSNKGIFGYDKTSKVLGTMTYVDSRSISHITVGWVINCSDGGFSSCPNLAYNPGPLTIDEQKSQDLLDYALAQIATNNLSGSSGTNVQVTGESFMRVYTLTWVSDDTVLTNSDIEVSCEYVYPS